MARAPALEMTLLGPRTAGSMGAALAERLCAVGTRGRGRGTHSLAALCVSLVTLSTTQTGRKRAVEMTSPRPGVRVHLGSRMPATAAARAAEIALGPNVVSRNQGCEWARALKSLSRRPLYFICSFLYKIHRAV